jgi:predicted negative regulator of RcsB-dependent stress response
VYLAQEEVTSAIERFSEALAKFRESQDTLWEGRTQISIGRAEAAAGRADEALAAYQAAWPLLVEQGAHDLERLEALMRPRQGSRDPKPGAGQE